MGLYLGIDGGQSSTTALIAEENGRVIGAGRSGPCNHVSAQEAAAKFSRVITECVNDACVSAGVDPKTVEFSAACCGMSGGPDDKAGLLESILRTAHLRVVTDGEIALTGAMAGKPGVIVIAGTGSVCFGRNAAGRLARAGGWGYIFGDDGSAFDIARQATQAALRFEEGWGPKTELHRMLRTATAHATANAMMHSFYTASWPRSRVAQLAVVVDAAAGGGDSVAQAILQRAAQSLAVLATCVRDQIFDAADAAPVGYVGGAFHSELLLERFRRLVELSGSPCRKPELNAAAGALLEAFHLCGQSVTLSEVPDMK